MLEMAFMWSVEKEGGRKGGRKQRVFKTILFFFFSLEQNSNQDLGIENTLFRLIVQSLK